MKTAKVTVKYQTSKFYTFHWYAYNIGRTDFQGEFISTKYKKASRTNSMHNVSYGLTLLYTYISQQVNGFRISLFNILFFSFFTTKSKPNVNNAQLYLNRQGGINVSPTSVTKKITSLKTPVSLGGNTVFQY